MDLEKRRSTPSITERIKSANTELGVSMAEIEQEMTRFYNGRDTDGIVRMFDAYHDWENRQAHTAPKKRTPHEIRYLALGNFDLIASIADNKTVTVGDEVLAITMAIHSNSEISGPIRQFFREAVGFKPQLPNSN